jgi:hypothetical protein
MTDTISDCGETSSSDDDPTIVDPHVGKYYLEMAGAWGASPEPRWRAWLRRIVPRRHR